MPNVAHVCDMGGPFSKHGDDGERLHCVADRVHVHIDTVQRTTNDSNTVGLVAYFAAHLFETIDEGDVTLQAACRQPLYRDFATHNCRRGPKITCARCIWFD